MKHVITNSICCDIILPLTDHKRFIYLIENASATPQWLRHSFVVVIAGLTSQEEQEMQDWYYDIRVKKALPNVTFIKAKEEIFNNVTALYQAGLVACDNPFVYMQDEKDELPINIDKTINFLYKNTDIDMAVAQCETFIDRHTPIEKFPATSLDNEFFYDCEEATKLFPSYLHPLSSVVRKSVFDKIPYFDMDKNFNEFAYYYFMLRVITNPNVKVEYLPYTIKVSNRSKEHAVIIGPKLRNRLIHDIKLWVGEFVDSQYRNFQLEVLDLLEKGEITTFKEIDARIEEHLEFSKR